MARNFRLKLTVILIVLSLVLSFLIAMFDYFKLKENVIVSQANKISMAEDKIISSLSTIDTVYDLFDEEMAEKMKDFSFELIHKYEEESDFAQWDFHELKNKFEMEVFILDDKNTVVHSSFLEDIGLSFSECCPGFSKLLDDRREGDRFSHDGMDIQSRTGEIKKFSYIPTPDHHYLIELAVSLENEDLFKKFNFLETSKELEDTYDIIDSIHVYNSGGLLLGHKTENFEQKKIQEPFYSVFKEVGRSGEPKELTVEEEGHQKTYRYIPYKADERRGYSTDRVVEIVYNDSELTGLLHSYKNQFILQLGVIMIAAVGLSFIIGRLVATPIHLAFHDSLTGLKNRAAFEDEVQRNLARGNSIALLMIDLDNFKLVNDRLGHGEGDRILKQAARIISEVVEPSAIAARVGGDEFLVLFLDAEEQRIRRTAEDLLLNMQEGVSEMRIFDQIHLSISIGISFSDSGDTFETLYTKADEALYVSKDNGKNQYNVYGKY
ncbi:GGDEF domain-containing protein [Sporosarcina sp. Te-1]|uniref:GGDEF domain-containing protein n=1 Tax=Sporosarcina sp. Te-1 TaxID=2818390 RepID=UPI001A9E1C41|nr:GGDEF domain-containing protein [Sporosarcina sp. Te-1]QTD41464.1 GGDEF domain-containing protein [Sporosarcina sp. Te-1]